MCAVTHPACRQALLKQGVVLLRKVGGLRKRRSPTLHLGLGKCHSSIPLKCLLFHHRTELGARKRQTPT